MFSVMQGLNLYDCNLHLGDITFLQGGGSLGIRGNRGEVSNTVVDGDGGGETDTFSNFSKILVYNKSQSHINYIYLW